MEKKSHQNALFLITLALMSMAGLVGTDVYLPALPEMGKALGQGADSMQLTLGTYLFGLAAGQLILGPLTDCFGRKKMLLISMIIFFAYIAQSPFIFHAQGFGERAIGLFYITLSLSYVAGSFTGRRYIKRHSLDEVLIIGFKYFVFGAFFFLLVGLCNFPLIFMVVAISMITFANGFLIPMGIAGVMSSFPGRVGYASGLLGFFQLGIAGLTSSFIGEISLNQVDRLAEFIFLAVLLSVFIRWIVSLSKAVEVVS